MRAQLSINQLTEFYSGTENKRKRIIEQQKIPNKFLLPWYQQAKAGMRRYFTDINEISPILKTIDLIVKKPATEKKWTQTNKQVSIEAMQRLLEMKMPSILRNNPYEIIKPHDKTVDIYGLNIIVAPEVIIKVNIEGKNVYGAIKFHISKSKPFSNEQASISTSIIYEYVKKKVAGKDGIVIPELCFSLDVFGLGLVHAPVNRVRQLNSLSVICNEVINLWNAA